MHVIKMERDKSLVTTIHATIYQGEKNADTLVFLIPKYYENSNIADCSLLLRYILPGNSGGRSEELMLEPIPYNDEYYRYHLSVDTKLTAEPGEITLWLSAIDLEDNLVLKSGETTIEVEPAKDIADYLTPEDMDQLDALEAKVRLLEKTKADNMLFDSQSSSIQLYADGAPIGEPIVIQTATGGVSDVAISDNKELIVTFANGEVKNLGAVSGYVYVPTMSDRKVLTWTIENAPGQVPPPVDLNPHDEWSSVDESEIETEYTWEQM